MTLFSRRRSTDEVLESALDRVLGAQSKQIEAISTLLEKMSELSMKRAAQALGSRGGRKRAENDARRRALTNKTASGPACRLCRNPAITNPTVQEIIEHNQHEIAEHEPRQIELQPSEDERGS